MHTHNKPIAAASRCTSWFSWNAANCQTGLLRDISGTNKAEAPADGKHTTQMTNKSPGQKLLLFKNKLYITRADFMRLSQERLRCHCTQVAQSLPTVLWVMKSVITVYKLQFFYFIFFLLGFIASPKLDFKPGYPKRIYKRVWRNSKSV